ncbi:MAG: FAD-binding oxidoreductase [Gammaproteobacteria bacterium]|nr:FAD-binding oxidoreductase [Gammaproteobacteria bacterium]
MERRRLLEFGAAALLAPGLAWASRRRTVNDYSGLTDVEVASEMRPQSTQEVGRAVADWPGSISIGGGRFSMGGQVGFPDSLHIDMRTMNRILFLDVARRVVRVQAGATWRDLLDVLDPHDLSVKIMQSFSNFTVGGSVSVNCHGRYVRKGPLINSVRAVQLVTADGRSMELRPDDELFRGVFGAYGGLGVVTEVELDLEPNARLARRVDEVVVADYPARFEALAHDPQVLLHNADLRPPRFETARLISWRTTDEDVTTPERLIPRDRDYGHHQAAIWAVSELPGGPQLRERVEQRMLARKVVVWRNYEASLDTDSLEPSTRRFSTYLLQEYFVPVPNFARFVAAMSRILRGHKVNAINVSIRHSPRDDRTLMTWAPQDVFSFVLYYKQRQGERARRRAGVWTRALIDAALANGGRYYLPYRLHASASQFRQAYPEVDAFRRLKARFDPQGKFRNLLWEKYLGASQG